MLPDCVAVRRSVFVWCVSGVSVVIDEDRVFLFSLRGCLLCEVVKGVLWESCFVKILCCV